MPEVQDSSSDTSEDDERGHEEDEEIVNSRFLENERQQRNPDRVSTSGIYWQAEAPQTGRTQEGNILRSRARVTVDITTITSSFDAMLSPDLPEEILICTNREGKRAHVEKRIYWTDVDMIELKAFIGLLLQTIV